MSTVYRAIFFVILGGFFGTCMDATAKYLTEFYPPTQVALMRNSAALPFLLGYLIAEQGRGAFGELRVRQWRRLLLRGVLIAGAQITFFTSLASLQLATATTLVFLAPALMVVLSIPMLGERVGPWRWAAVVIGFCGVLIIQRPTDDALFPWTLLPVATAFFFATAMVMLRQIDKSVPTSVISLYSVMASAAVSLLFLLYAAVPVTHVWPVLLLGILGTLTPVFMNHGFRMASPGVLAPFDYFVLVFAFIIGWLVWGEVPPAVVWIGAAVIVGAGMIIIWREQRAERAHE